MIHIRPSGLLFVIEYRLWPIFPLISDAFALNDFTLTSDRLNSRISPAATLRIVFSRKPFLYCFLRFFIFFPFCWWKRSRTFTKRAKTSCATDTPFTSYQLLRQKRPSLWDAYLCFSVFIQNAPCPNWQGAHRCTSLIRRHSQSLISYSLDTDKFVGCRGVEPLLTGWKPVVLTDRRTSRFTPHTAMSSPSTAPRILGGFHPHATLSVFLGITPILLHALVSLFYIGRAP